MDQFLKLGGQHFMDDVERLNMREDEIIADGYFTDDRQTLRKIKEKRRKDTVEYNMKTFSKQTIGIYYLIIKVYMDMNYLNSLRIPNCRNTGNIKRIMWKILD